MGACLSVQASPSHTLDFAENTFGCGPHIHHCWHEAALRVAGCTQQDLSTQVNNELGYAVAFAGCLPAAATGNAVNELADSKMRMHGKLVQITHQS